MTGTQGGSLRRRARTMVGRVLGRTPAPDARVGASPARSAEPLVTAPFLDQHAALHEARTLALADMAPGAMTVLSVGANGRWYFDWFDEFYGQIDRHIGVEPYMPRPDDLPSNVEWLEADVAGLEGAIGVDPASVDLVFSGQNIEHLWPDQMVALLLEANRLLRPGGWLVVDSPNRILTSAYGWSMLEHTVELTPDEAVALFELAGFEVEVMKGLWLCRHRDASGERLDPLEPDTGEGGAGRTLRRLALAAKRPEDSFIWWAEARKIGLPDDASLRAAVLGLFARAWQERVDRVRPHDGTAVELADDRPGAELASGVSGFVVAGPWMPMPPGAYDFTVEVRWGEPADPGPLGRLEVVVGQEVLGSTPIDGATGSGSATVTCRVALAEQQFGVHVRVASTGRATMAVPLGLRVDPDPWRSRLPT
jgi:SAM-dependent methyltransferase